jgi:hypothetical protein
MSFAQITINFCIQGPIPQNNNGMRSIADNFKEQLSFLSPFLNQNENANASEQRRDSTGSTERSRTAQPTNLTFDLKME